VDSLQQTRGLVEVLFHDGVVFLDDAGNPFSVAAARLFAQHWKNLL
jgi:hypothetical protein